MIYRKLFTLIILINSCSTFDYDKSKCFCEGIQNEFNEFMYQAKIRGIKIRNKPLKVKLVSYIGENVSGRTYPLKKIIEFDTTHWAWTSLKEKIVMHELGHYYLKRHHITGTIFLEHEDRPISIMVSGANIYLNLISEDLRKYYLDELFYN